jgi:hypothetical protein
VLGRGSLVSRGRAQQRGAAPQAGRRRALPGVEQGFGSGSALGRWRPTVLVGAEPAGVRGRGRQLGAPPPGGLRALTGATSSFRRRRARILPCEHVSTVAQNLAAAESSIRPVGVDRHRTG